MSGQGNNKTWAERLKESIPPKEELEECISNSREEIHFLKEQLRSLNQKLKNLTNEIQKELVIENSEGLPSFVFGTAIAVHGSYIRSLEDESIDLAYNKIDLKEDLEKAQLNLNKAKNQLRELEKISSSDK